MPGLGTQCRRGLGEPGLNTGFKLIIRGVLCVFILIQPQLDKHCKPIKCSIVCLVFSLFFFTMNSRKPQVGLTEVSFILFFLLFEGSMVLSPSETILVSQLTRAERSHMLCWS